MFGAGKGTSKKSILTAVRPGDERHVSEPSCPRSIPLSSRRISRSLLEPYYGPATCQLMNMPLPVRFDTLHTSEISPEERYMPRPV